MKKSDKGLRAELIRKAVGVGGMKIINMIFTFLITLILARELKPQGYGTYVFVISLIMLVSLPANAGVPELALREVAKYQVNSRWSFLKGLLRRGHHLIALLSVAILFFMIPLCILKADWTSADRWTLMLLASPLVPLVALRNLRSAVLRGLRKIIQGQLPEKVIYPIAFLSGIGILKMQDSLTPAMTIVVQVLATVISFGAGTWLLVKMIPEEVQGAVAEYEDLNWFRALVPFTLLAGVSLLNSHVSVVLLGFFSNAANVGLYRVASQGAMLVTMSLIIVNNVISPYITRLHEEGDMEKLQLLAIKSSRVVLLGALPVSLLFFFAGDAVLGVLFGEAYRAAYSALVILTVGQMVNAAMGSVGMLLTMTGFERKTLKGLSVALVATILLSVVLIPFLGAIGAAIATTVSLITWNCYLYRQVYLQLHIKSAAWISIRKLK